MGTKTTMLVHVLDDNLKAVGKPIRAKTSTQEVNWRKRMWAINHISDDVKITDHKGITHTFVHVNETDGTFHFITPKRQNLFDYTRTIKVNGTEHTLSEYIAKPIDMCAQCGDRITIDARNARDMLKRKTIDTFWGIDSSHILLLLIMGIVAIAGFGAVFYLLGQVQNLQAQLNKYLPTPEEVKASRGVTNQFIMPFVWSGIN